VEHPLPVSFLVDDVNAASVPLGRSVRQSDHGILVRLQSWEVHKIRAADWHVSVVWRLYQSTDWLGPHCRENVRESPHLRNVNQVFEHCELGAKLYDAGFVGCAEGGG